jgi:hypothetical protein
LRRSTERQQGLKALHLEVDGADVCLKIWVSVAMRSKRARARENEKDCEIFQTHLSAGCLRK